MVGATKVTTTPEKMEPCEKSEGELLVYLRQQLGEYQSRALEAETKLIEVFGLLSRPYSMERAEEASELIKRAESAEARVKELEAEMSKRELYFGAEITRYERAAFEAARERQMMGETPADYRYADFADYQAGAVGKE